MSISVPTDDEGYVLLKCEHYGDFFRGAPNDLQGDGVLHIFCPSCELISGSYITDDVLELTIRTATNYANDIICDASKNLGRHNRMNSMIEFKVEKKPHHKTEDPIRSGVETLEICAFPCCKCIAEIKSLLKMTSAYYPFCGVRNYEVG